MARPIVTALGLIGLLSSHAHAGPIRDRIRANIAKKTSATPAPGASLQIYGSDPAQTLDLWRAKGASAPTALIIFVHGGGWKRGSKDNATGAAKVEHLTGLGYAVASINYRLVPEATVEQQAADVVSSVAYLRRNAARLGIDPTRVILMGHSAGAHLVALVGTDPRYLKDAGLSEADLRGVILLDGACYDVPRQIAEGGNFMRDSYVQAFGGDVARQRALSPTFHAANPNAPSFLILHVDREDGKAQSEALGAALSAAGTAVELKGFEGKGLRGHMAINRSLGDADYPATATVDAWLKRML